MGKASLLADCSDSREAAGIYVHLPFCSAICPYCDFAVTVGGRARQIALVEALLLEIEREGPKFEAVFDTIYLGGGTPSLMASEDLERILQACRRELSIEDGRLFMEANPEDVTEARLSEWLALGLGTLSLGVQALDDRALKFLGRRHTATEARQAVEAARRSGVETVSVDLIYSRPGQTVAAWKRELELVAELEPDHLSCYQLTINSGTPFGRLKESGRLSEMPEPGQAELFEATHEELKVLGFEAYEISNFARSPEHRSRHNKKYWSGTSYLGLGPSAHSFHDNRRWWNVPDTSRYIDRLEANETPMEDSESLSRGDRLLEELMMGLRTTRGVELAAVESRYGVDLVAANRQRLEDWQCESLMRVEKGFLTLTLSGLLLADRLASDLDLGSLEPES
jgi:oxygen-independent coproporphyrinogen-3 oxidase